jgi:hypothetical protein
MPSQWRSIIAATRSRGSRRCDLSESRHAGLRPVRAAEPDRPLALQVADDDAVGMPAPDRDFVDPDHLRRRLARPVELGLHVLALERLDGVPVELEFARHLADRRLPAAAPDVPGEALGVERVAGQEVQPFGLHLAAPAAVHTPDLQFEPDPRVAAGQVPDSSRLAVVPARLGASASAADRFFPRRTRLRTRACGSPNTPRTVALGRQPGNRYASSRRRRLGLGRCMPEACQISGHPVGARCALIQALWRTFGASSRPHGFTKTPNVMP